jgi:DNA-binding HxlR family transcriptional regulator
MKVAKGSAMNTDNDVQQTLCPIARALAVVGDRWTLMILRELTLGSRRFDDIQAQTGMSSQILAARLKRLEEQGVVERRRYNIIPARYEYHSTEKGLDLDSVLLMLRSWGLKWCVYPEGGERATHLRRENGGEEIGAEFPIGPDGKAFRFTSLQREMSSGFASEREQRRLAFQTMKEGRRARRQA